MDTEPVLRELIERYERNSLLSIQDQQLQVAGQQQPSPQNQPLPPNWIVRVDPKTGRTYYANTVTKTTQWELPQNSSLATTIYHGQSPIPQRPHIQPQPQKSATSPQLDCSC